MDNADIVIVEDNHHDVEMILDAFRELKLNPKPLFSVMELKRQNTSLTPRVNLSQKTLSRHG